MPDELPAGPLVWAAAGGDRCRRGLFGGAVQIAPAPARRLVARGSVQAPVVFDANGTAFVSDMAGGVQAFGRDGERRWEVLLAGGVSAAPVVAMAASRLFVGTHAGRLYALDATTGQEVWRREIPTRGDPRILSDLLLLEEPGLVVVSSWGGRFWALDAGTAAERAAWDAGISPRSAAAAAGGSIYCLRAVGGTGVELVRVTPDGSQAVLDREPETPRGARRTVVGAAPVVDEARGAVCFVTNGDRAARLHAWSLGAERRTWTCDLPAAVDATPVVLPDGTVVVADLAGGLQAIGRDGATAWRYVTGAEYLLAGPVAELGSRLWLGDPLGIVHEVDRDGRGRAMFELPRSLQGRPSFDPSGGLYVPCMDHGVYVFPAASRPALATPDA